MVWFVVVFTAPPLCSVPCSFSLGDISWPLCGRAGHLQKHPSPYLSSSWLQGSPGSELMFPQENQAMGAGISPTLCERSRDCAQQPGLGRSSEFACICVLGIQGPSFLSILWSCPFSSPLWGQVPAESRGMAYISGQPREERDLEPDPGLRLRNYLSAAS